jgi:hypothetical protein
VENLAVVALIFLNFIVGCSKSPSRLTPPDIDADAAAAALIEEYDMNKNSALDGEELDHIPAIKSALNKYDTNGDKQVSAEEIKSRIESWQIVPVASMPISCTVRLGRQPLANATIVLEPEKPFAGQLKRAIGKTDRGGFAQFSIQLDEESERSLNGVQCGLYKVRITAPLGGGRELPAKYNAKTKLGLEVAPDAAFMRSGLRFDL